MAHHTHLEDPFGAVQMGLIYVNPEDPNGNPDPAASARDIRETFHRMAMNDEETVALTAGGHTFGKTHGAADPDAHVGPEPEGAPLQEQGLGWRSSYGSGTGADTITSGLEGAWTATPIRWDNSYFETLFENEWELVSSPAGAHQWAPKDGAAAGTVPDAHDPSRTHAPMMSTADMAMRTDPDYERIARRFYEHPDELADAFARAWFKLTHRDMGPIARYRGPEVPTETLIWQDPIPAVTHELVGADDVAALKRKILDSGLRYPSSSARHGRRRRRSAARTSAAAPTARASACSPSAAGRSTTPTSWRPCCAPWRASATPSTARRTGGRRQVSLADLIVLGGCAAIEQAARDAGRELEVPFTPGRADAAQEQTDADSFAALEPTADGFRNYLRAGHRLQAEYLLLDRANLLTLSAPQMTVLVGGLRVLGANHGGSSLGVLTDAPGTLTNDLFVNLLDAGTSWSPASGNGSAESFEGRDAATGELRWTASRVDLVFGSNSELRAIAEVYASDDAHETFARDFAAAWAKVMDLDRFGFVVAVLAAVALLAAAERSGLAAGGDRLRRAMAPWPLVSLEMPPPFVTPSRPRALTTPMPCSCAG